MPRIIQAQQKNLQAGVLFPGNPATFLGNSVKGGDINGDGFSDVILGASKENNSTGAVYVIFGNYSLPSSFNINTLDGKNGFKIMGDRDHGSFGFSLGVGDINNDGLNDIFVGAPNGYTKAPPFIQGKAYVIFGKTEYPPQINVSNLNSTTGFVIINDQPQTRGIGLGYSISNVGDLNNDNIDDMGIGAPNLEIPYFSEPVTYVIFGNKVFSEEFNLSNLNGTNGFMIRTKQLNNKLFGSAVANAGDVNGDEISDLMVSAPDASTVYTVYGRKEFPLSLYVEELDGSNGFNITTAEKSPKNQFGFSISSGDFNNDRFTDMIVGAPYDTLYDSPQEAGAVYVIVGNTTFPPSVDATALNGKNGFLIGGDKYLQKLGESVALTDINGDNIGDLLMGTAAVSNHTRGYVLYGHNSPFFPVTSVSLINGNNGFTIINSDKSTVIVGNADDVNGDGVNDMLIGNPIYDPNGAYLIFGRNSTLPPFPANITLPPLDKPSQEQIFNPRQRKLLSKNDLNQLETRSLSNSVSVLTNPLIKGAIGFFSTSTTALLSGEKQSLPQENHSSIFDVNTPAALIVGSFSLLLICFLIYKLLKWDNSNQEHGNNMAYNRL